jgi:site-specific DNA recombinase
MRLAAYTRVSRVGGRDGDSFISPDVQRQQIERYCELYGHDIAGWWQDLDESGGKMARPDFEAMMVDVERGCAEGVIVSKLDRFARTVPGAYEAIQRLTAHGAQLVSVTEQLDTSNPNGKFARTIFFAMAELERDRITESWAQAREHAVARGVHISTRTPTGYDKTVNGILEPNADSAAVQEAFRLRAAGASNREIAEMLNRRGVVGAHGSAGWAPAAVQRLLKNRVYLGEARSGQFVNPAAHAPLVSLAEYQAAAAHRGLRPARSDDGMLLSGLVRCAGCRYRMAGTKGTRDGKPNPTYRCKRRHAAGLCLDSAAISAPLIERYIIERFEEAIEPGGMVFEAHTSTDDLRAAEERAQAAEAELTAFMESEAVSAGLAAFNAALQTRIAARDAANTDLAAARAKAAPAFDPISGADVWLGADTAERRLILSAAIDAVYIGKRSVAGHSLDERVRIFWRGTGPADVPRIGKPAEGIRPLTWLK